MVPLIGLVIIFAFFLLVLTALHFNWKFKYWSNRKVKTLPVHPVFGNIADVVYKKIPIFEMMTTSYNACRLNGDKYIGFYCLNKPALVVTDLELIKCILEKDFNNFTDRTLYENEKPDSFSVSLTSITRETASTLKKLETYSFVLKSVGEQLKNILNRATETPNIVILQHLSKRFVVDVISMTIFGKERNTLINLSPDFEYYVKKTFSCSLLQNLKMFLSFLYPGVLDFFGMPFQYTKMKTFFNNLTQNLIHSLMQIRNYPVIEGETGEEIAAQLTLFFAAGYETTSTNITFVLYEIMYARYLQENLRSEINAVLEKHNGEITYEALMEMTYLESCIYESLRKHPAVSGITRVCTADYRVPDNDLVIEKGTTIIVPVINIHNDPTYYPNPENFKPDRFLSKNKERKPGYAFLPFGEVPRSCIGSRLAILKIKLFIAILLKDFRVSINLKTKFPMQYNDSSAQLMFKEELFMNIRKLHVA